MSILLPILLVIIGILGIFYLHTLTARLQFRLLADSRLDGLFKFQLAQVLWSVLILVGVYLLASQNFVQFFRVGDLQAYASPIPWLGITGKESWLQVIAILGIFITLGTGAFMFLQVKKSKATFRLSLTLFCWSLFFSALNAFSEEAIFRMGVVSPLYGKLALPWIAVLSGVLFGLPHYFGKPSGVVGVLMAGFLGWLLALSLLETRGLFLAWALHFVQDVVIFVSMFGITAPDSATGKPATTNSNS
ncbi:MAG TPA: CPBP family intramembrane metalloprotease [Anaerolineales bacterium]|nr:CPBP family intramembrane metalloprotease [Anaerolineales bacterium]